MTRVVINLFLVSTAAALRNYKLLRTVCIQLGHTKEMRSAHLKALSSVNKMLHKDAGLFTAKYDRMQSDILVFL